MNTLVVVTHPIQSSLCQHLAKEVIEHLESKGHSVIVKDLYKEQFDPVLSEKERQSYYADHFDASKTQSDIEFATGELGNATVDTDDGNAYTKFPVGSVISITGTAKK